MIIQVFQHKQSDLFLLLHSMLQASVRQRNTMYLCHPAGAHMKYHDIEDQNRLNLLNNLQDYIDQYTHPHDLD